MRTLKLILPFGVGLLIFALVIYFASPTIRRHLAASEVVWSSSAPGFAVEDATLESWDGFTRLRISCRWQSPPKPWDRYLLEFPAGEVTYSNGKRYRDDVSPTNKPGTFVIFAFVNRAPSPLAKIDLPIRCRDTASQRDLGISHLSFRYWPSQAAM